MNKSNLSIQYGDIYYRFVLKMALRGCNSVLDVGCGVDSPLGKIERTFLSEGVDAWPDVIKTSKKKKFHDSYRLGDIRKLQKFYRKKSFDAVVCLDVIEHFTKAEAFSLIKQMEAIACKKVIILTPNGFYHQDTIDENIYQRHFSGWVPKEFEKLSYSVYGLRGLKTLRTDHASIRYSPWFFWAVVAFVSEILLYRFPSVSFDIFAIKEME